MSTPDIFLSYNREDAARAKHFADAFAAEGLEVWWDTALRSGEAYDKVTEEALRGAKAVVVLWSKRSVESRWVRAEATLADRRKTLVPAMIEPCERPIMFELTQTAELSHWQGDGQDEVWQAFLADVWRFVERGAQDKRAKGRQRSEVPADIAMPQASLVVLPFVNMSEDAGQEYFADGITEDIITDLSKLPSVRVISRNSAFTFKGRHVDVVDVARQLNVDHVLEGSVRKAGNRVRVTAQLIDGSTNAHVWAERYDRELADIFDLQEELSHAIVKALKVRLLPEDRNAFELRGTRNLEAHDLYMRARALHKSLVPNEASEAMRLFRQATEIDPDFAQCWAEYAVSVMAGRMILAPQDWQSWSEVDLALDRLALIAPDSLATYALRGWRAQWDYDWEAADEAVSKATRLEGISEGALGIVQLGLGRAADAIESHLLWRNTDPLSMRASLVAQYTLEAGGRPDEANAEYQRCLGLGGEARGAHAVAAYRALHEGKLDVAETLFARLAQDQYYDSIIMPTMAKSLRDPIEALNGLHRVLASREADNPVMLTRLARFAVHFGDFDLAITALRRALVEQKHGFAIVDLWSQNLIRLRQDPRFKDILRDIGLADFWRRSGNWGDFARPRGNDDFEMIA